MSYVRAPPAEVPVKTMEPEETATSADAAEAAEAADVDEREPSCGVNTEDFERENDLEIQTDDEEQIVAATAEEQIDAPTAEEQIVAPTAEEQIDAPTAEEQIVAPTAEEQIVAPKAEEPRPKRARVSSPLVVDNRSLEEMVLVGEMQVRFENRYGSDGTGLVKPMVYGNVVITCEPINVESIQKAIECLGGIQLNGSNWHEKDKGRTVKDVFQVYLDRVVRHDCVDHKIGWIYSAFKDCKFARENGIRGRLYTGCKVNELPPQHLATLWAKDLVTRGRSDFDATRGVFALPRELKHIARSGIHGGPSFLATAECDLKTSHPRAVLHRMEERGLQTGPLKHVIEDRDTALREIHPDEPDAAKELVNSLINGGSFGVWKAEHTVRHALPKWTEDLQILLTESATHDAQENPLLLKACKGKKAAVTFWLNSQFERVDVDAMEKRVVEKTEGVPVSYEGDCILFVHRTATPRQWQNHVLEEASGVVRCAMKPTPPLTEAFAAVLKRTLKTQATKETLQLATSSTEPQSIVTLLTTGSYSFTKTTRQSVKGELPVPAKALKTTDLFDGGKGRAILLAHSSSATAEEAFTDFSDVKSNATGVLAAEMASKEIMCVIVKDKNTRLQFDTKKYQLRSMTVGKQKLADARLDDVYVLLSKHRHVTNMEAEAHGTDFIPDFEQLCLWLYGHLKERKLNEVIFDCKRLIKLKSANAYQKALVEVAPAQVKEHADAYTQASQSVRLVDDPTLKTYPKDFKETVPDLIGVLWNEATGLKHTTLKEALDGDDELALNRTMIFVGKQSTGKTTLLRALGREMSNRLGFDRFADSTALDPFGVMTKAGLTKDLGAVCLNDFELMSCLNQHLTAEGLKGLLDAGDTTSFNCRYHVATLPGGRPRFWAVNPNKTNGTTPDWGSWFMKFPYSECLAFLAEEKEKEIEALSESDKAIIRRAVIFKISEPLYDAPEPASSSTETQEQAKRRRTALDASRYQL
jgi:hypothetical protein